jgi:type I restriction enzyme S subunit
MSDNLDYNFNEIPFYKTLVDESISYGIVQPGFAVIENSVPVIRVNNFENGKINTDDIKSVDKEIEKKFLRTRLKGGELLITVVGSIGETAIATNEMIGWNVARAVSVANIKESYNVNYLKYCFKTKDVLHQIYGNTNNTVQPTLNLSSLKNIILTIPNKKIQDEIASILTAFDDKIELLQSQNKTLEETAQTIFAEWFGKYSVDDELPDGWSVGKLSEIANLKSGFAFKAEDFIEESNFKAIKIKDLKGNGNISLSDVSAITEEITKLDRVQYFKLVEGDILLAMSGNTTGKIGVLPSSENEIYLNQRVGKFFMKDKKYNSFLYNFLMSGSFEEKILGMGYGSAQPNINPSQIENIDIIYPDETKMTDYLKISNPIFEKVLKNITQIQTLTKTRDELLPRLMSGEVRVNEFK